MAGGTAVELQFPEFQIIGIRFSIRHDPAVGDGLMAQHTLRFGMFAGQFEPRLVVVEFHFRRFLPVFRLVTLSTVFFELTAVFIKVTGLAIGR